MRQEYLHKHQEQVINIPKKAKLVIELREDGKVYVTGPLEQKQLCLAMIEEAKETVSNWKKTFIAIPNIKEIIKDGTTRI